MSEQLSQRQPLEFTRIVPPEAVNTDRTVDAFRAAVPLPGQPIEGSITITLGDMLRLPVTVDGIAYPFTGSPGVAIGMLADQIAFSAGRGVFAEVAAKQKGQSIQEMKRTGSAYTSSTGDMRANGIHANRLIHVVFDPQTEAASETAIEDAVTGVLDAASSENLRSVAVPLLGTGGLSAYPVSAAESLARIVRATEQYMTAHPDTPTKDVRVVAFYEPSENVLNGVQRTLSEIG